MPIILHDFDNPYPSGRWALKRGFKLMLYAASKRVPLLRRWCREIYDENLLHAFTLLRLDQLLDISSTFGINHRVLERWPDLERILHEQGARVVQHWHVSENEVHWLPELNVPYTQWFFDREYALGVRGLPEEDEWIVWHCDYPQLLDYYIKLLYDLKFSKMEPLAK